MGAAIPPRSGLSRLLIASLALMVAANVSIERTFAALSGVPLPVLQERPASSPALVKAITAFNQARAYCLLGKIRDRQAKEAQATQPLLEAINLDSQLGEAHVALGNHYIRARNFRAAESEFRLAISLGDASGEGAYGLGSALMAGSRYSEALPYLATAAKKKSEDPDRLSMLIMAELQLNENNAARSGLTQLERLSPPDAFVLYGLGNLLLKRDMSNEAQAQFERAAGMLSGRGDTGLAPNPSWSPNLYFQIARLRLAHRDYWGALRFARRVSPSALDPPLRAAFLDVEGAALLGTGDASKALETLRQASRMEPSNSTYFAYAMWAELLAGNLQQAKAAANLAASRWAGAPDVSRLAPLVRQECAPKRARVRFGADWRLEGKGFVCCPCSVPCPCRSNAPSTHGHCENTGVYRISQGRYSDISLDGLAFAIVSGSMISGNSEPSLYVDSSTTDEQLLALERIFQSFDPLHPAEFVDVRRARIEFNQSQKDEVYQATVAGVLEIRIQRQLDSGGNPIHATAALDQFSNQIEYARNLIDKVWNSDGSLKWDFSGRQADFRTINLNATEYRNGTMLIQYEDGSGYFNHEQLELIKALKLPALPRYPDSGNHPHD